MANALLNAVKVALQAAMAQRKTIDLARHLATGFWLLAFGFYFSLSHVLVSLSQE